MNIYMSKEEFDQLPFRDTWQGEYNQGYYRAKAYPKTVFQWVGNNHEPQWWAFSVTFI